MKKKKSVTLFAALTACSVLLLNGCGVDLTNVNAEDTTLSAELETENLTDGTILVHSVWYASDGSRLSDAEVTLSSSDGELFTGTTDESGCLDACTLPGNTAITCEITDSSGEVIAEAEILFKLSSDYSELTIYTPESEEDSQCILEIPADKTDFRAAVFVTEDGRLSFANLTPYSESDETADEGDEASAEEGAETEDTAEGAESSADTGETAAEGDGTAADEAAAEGDAAAADEAAAEGDAAAADGAAAE